MTIDQSPIAQWVSEAPNKEQQEFREAVHTILLAIADDPNLQADMIIKGGILLAIRYHSHRYTKDIDFSTEKALKDIDPEQVIKSLDQSLTVVAENLDYGLDCKVQTHKILPPNKQNPTFPELEITIGFAYKGTPKHKRLLALKCPSIVKIDFSLNEPTPNIEFYNFGDEENLKAYSFTDVIAEKLRAFLQMGVRNRVRRQDIFDLYVLLKSHPEIDEHEQSRILDSLIIKSNSRDLKVDKNSFQDSELRDRAEKTYPELVDEVENELPEFDEVYETVKEFYENLPWK